MAVQEKKIVKKRGRPATGTGMQVVVRMQPPMLEALDAWIARQHAEDRPSRQDMIRTILRDWLIGNKLLKK